MKASLARGAQQANRWQYGEKMHWAVRYWATRIGVKAPQIRFQTLKTQWATISGGRMTLRPELLVLPKDLGEFVIVHELVHLLAPNHGKVFKLFLDAYLPGWEK